MQHTLEIKNNTTTNNNEILGRKLEKLDHFGFHTIVNYEIQQG